MKEIYSYVLLLSALLNLTACRDDQSHKQQSPPSVGPENIQLVVTGRIGSVVGDSLTYYVDALNLLLFRENEEGNYLLYRQKILEKQLLETLGDETIAPEAGFSGYVKVDFDSLPLGNYRIVGIANLLDSLGNALPNVSLQGAIAGASMSEVLVAIRDGELSSRLFLGATESIAAGGEALPILKLYRKVSMFSLTLLKIPEIVDRIDMEFSHLYASFNAIGNYTSGGDNFVLATNRYTQSLNDSITLNYVMLPTVSGMQTPILATFYYSAGKQMVNFPQYIFLPNTITKVTATIDVDQPGGAWKVNLNTLITINVEWNIDQEPPITI